MKRTIMSLLGALAVAAGFSMFAASAAHAASVRTVANGGVTCEQYVTTYSYPGSYWVCTATHANPTSAEKGVAQAADLRLTPSMKTTLANVEIMIFQNQNDFALFTGQAAPATKYVAWTAPNGPNVNTPDGQWLHGKRIAAVFARADLWSPNIAPTNQIATRDITASYKVHIGQALGRQYDQLTGNPSQLQETPVHIFPIAYEYDAKWLVETAGQTPTSVWGSTLAGQYSNPMRNSWEIFGILYGNQRADVYAFQFASVFGSNWSHLQQFMNTYLKETQGFREQQIFGSVTPLPVTGRYIAATNKMVFCVKYTKTYNAPANTIKNCVHPYGYKAAEVQAGAAIGSLPSSIRARLTSLGLPIQLSVMRDITDYETYYNLPVGNGAGDAGISYAGGHTDPAGVNEIPVVAFFDSLDDFPGHNLENFYSASLVHESAHMLDDLEWFGVRNLPAPPVLVAYSQSDDWSNRLNADISGFNALPCMTALNDAAACATAGTNWQRFLVKMGWNTKSDSWVRREMFCVMFQRKSATTTFAFMQNVENRFWSLTSPTSQMKAKMDTIFSTGSP